MAPSREGLIVREIRGCGVYIKDSEREEEEVVTHRLEGLNGRGRTGFGAQTDWADCKKNNGELEGEYVVTGQF